MHKKCKISYFFHGPRRKRNSPGIWKLVYLRNLSTVFSRKCPWLVTREQIFRQAHLGLWEVAAVSFDKRSPAPFPHYSVGLVKLNFFFLPETARIAKTGDRYRLPFSRNNLISSSIKVAILGAGLSHWETKAEFPKALPHRCLTPGIEQSQTKLLLHSKTLPIYTLYLILGSFEAESVGSVEFLGIAVKNIITFGGQA